MTIAGTEAMQYVLETSQANITIGISSLSLSGLIFFFHYFFIP
jgi:hypothetical protein